VTIPEITWRRSTRCASNACVEIGRDGADYLLRDSKDPGVPPIRFTPAEWEHFLTHLRPGVLTVA
jgi:hypothetical protein